ncbi:MAG: hypothetical protein V4678_01145 [Patescibacteria group bacterium]
MKRIVLAVAMVLGAGVFAALPAGAINVYKACNAANASEPVCQATGETVDGPVQAVISTLLVVIGIVAVIMIIVGGIRYTLSNGDASQIKSAKDTILYAVIGLVVAIMAYAIVNFVVSRFV